MLLLVALVMVAATHGTRALESAPVLLPQGFMVPLKQHRHAVPVVRRHLLRTGVEPVFGGVRELGYYYAYLRLGTPARAFSAILDTGSTMTSIPCTGCTQCGVQKSAWFDPAGSNTSRKLGCGDALCKCGPQTCSCNDLRCSYSRSYLEGSSTRGFMVQDVLRFSDGGPPAPLVFGCVQYETGAILTQKADGLLGLGNHDSALQGQLVAQGVIEDVFSLCYGHPGEGVMLLGDVALPPGGPPTYYTPLRTTVSGGPYYVVELTEMVVAGQTLELQEGLFSRGYGTIMDSGTTFTYLISTAFKALAEAVERFAELSGFKASAGSDPRYKDICWKGATETSQLDDIFPTVELTLGGNTWLSLSPLRYLFLLQPNEYCLGVFDNGFSGTIIGGIAVLDTLVTYDRRNGRVGFTQLSCGNLSRNLLGNRPANDSTSKTQPSPSLPTPSAPTPFSTPPPHPPSSPLANLSSPPMPLPASWSTGATPMPMPAPTPTPNPTPTPTPPAAAPTAKPTRKPRRRPNPMPSPTRHTRLPPKKPAG